MKNTLKIGRTRTSTSHLHLQNFQRKMSTSRILASIFNPRRLNLSNHRYISTTTTLHSSWMDSIKGVFTGNKTSTTPDQFNISSDNFTLLQFADNLKNGRRVYTVKQFKVRRSSAARFADASQKNEAITRYLGGFDPSGENIQTCQKQETARVCNCTIAEVESALAMFTWAKETRKKVESALAKFTWEKEAQKKVEKLKEEGKPIPKSMAEIQEMMGSTPLDIARSNLAKSGQISGNALCPCGSKKRYKRCCGKD